MLKSHMNLRMALLTGALLLVQTSAFGQVFLSAAQATDVFPRPLTEQEKEVFSTGVRNELKDPDSARFRWNPEVRDSGLYCGFVNAKNSFGGYTGHKAYMLFYGINRDGKLVVALVKFDNGPVYTRYRQYVGESAEAQMCAKHGYNLDPTKAQE